MTAPAALVEGSIATRPADAGDEVLAPLYPLLYEHLVDAALAEDLGRAGDLTADAVIPAGTGATARLVARRAGRIAGLAVAACAFQRLDPRLEVACELQDGEDAAAGQTLMLVQGPARPLLAAERTALNFLGHLSGIATATRDLVALIAGTGARLACTRKTTPGLRVLEKYAVRAGGGANHRFALDDAVMIKDNHRLVAGGITAAVARVRGRVGHMVKIEVEVDTLEQLREVLPLGVDAVLLDNMDPATLRQAVALARQVPSPPVLEASGGITPETAAAIAASGVDLLSVGWITHSAPRLDVALDVDLSAEDL